MSVNLLIHAPTQGTLFCLDDQPETADSEKTAAKALNLEWRPTNRPRKFVDEVLDWKQRWLHELSDEERMETKAALIIDNRMKSPVDIEDFIEDRPKLEEAKARLPQNKQLLDTDQGSRTGLIFIQYVIRGVGSLRDMPVMLLSAFPILKYENAIRRLNEEYDAPTQYVPKASSKKNGSDGSVFDRIVAKWIFDRRLFIMHRLAYDLWDLSEGEVCGALALRSGNVKDVGELFDRRRREQTTNTDQRVNCLRIIHERMLSLFDGSRDVVQEWLTKPVARLGGSPRELICSGDMFKLSLVKGYVEMLTTEPWLGQELKTADAHLEQAKEESQHERE